VCQPCVDSIPAIEEVRSNI